MNILNLFKKTKQPVMTPTTANLEEQALTVNKTLFVEEKSPVEEEVKPKRSELDEFLSKSFFSEGFNDGYHYHNADLLEIKMSKLKQLFLGILDRRTDAFNVEIYDLKQHLLATDGLSTRVSKQLEDKILTLEDCIQKLEQHKTATYNGEGLISSTLIDYKEGFMRGLMRYQDEKLLATSTGLFN